MENTDGERGFREEGAGLDSAPAALMRLSHFHLITRAHGRDVKVSVPLSPGEAAATLADGSLDSPGLRAVIAGEAVAAVHRARPGTWVAVTRCQGSTQAACQDATRTVATRADQGGRSMEAGGGGA